MMMGREKIFITPEKRKKHDFSLPFFLCYGLFEFRGGNKLNEVS
jgi:hypothetical protein